MHRVGGRERPRLLRVKEVWPADVPEVQLFAIGEVAHRRVEAVSFSGQTPSRNASGSQFGCSCGPVTPLEVEVAETRWVSRGPGV